MGDSSHFVTNLATQEKNTSRDNTIITQYNNNTTSSLELKDIIMHGCDTNNDYNDNIHNCNGNGLEIKCISNTTGTTCLVSEVKNRPRITIEISLLLVIVLVPTWRHSHNLLYHWGAMRLGICKMYRMVGE